MCPFHPRVPLAPIPKSPPACRPYKWVNEAKRLDEVVETRLTEAVHGDRRYSTTFKRHLPVNEYLPHDPFTNSLDLTVGNRQDFGDSFKRFSRPNMFVDRGLGLEPALPYPDVSYKPVTDS